MKRTVVSIAASLMILAGFPAEAGRVEGWITFLSDRSGDEAIYMVRPDGSDLRGPIGGLGTGSLHGPELSPDGSRIAFSKYTVNCVPGVRCKVDSDVWLVNADGSNEVQLTDDPGEVGYSPTWSPDGKTIVYEGANETTWGDLFALTETAPREWSETKLTERPGSEGLPAFSPDGRFIAYAYYADEVPTWSPDSRKIALLRYGDKALGVWMVKRDGSGKRRLIAGAALRPSWSHNRRYLVFELCNTNIDLESCRIERLDRQTGRTKVITDAPVKYDGNPHWGGVEL